MAKRIPPEQAPKPAQQSTDNPLTILPHRDQDRGNGDGDPPSPLGWVALRFRDLQAARIAGTWNQLHSLIRNEGFPLGYYLGANTRVWWLHDVLEWLKHRPKAEMPIEPPAHAARHNGRPRGRPRKPAADSAAEGA
jgi:hypothetical protein